MESSLDSIVAIVAAVGGLTGLAALLSVIKKWREGIRGRESDASDKHNLRLDEYMKRQDNRIAALEAANEHQDRYIDKLHIILSRHGIEIPRRDL